MPASGSSSVISKMPRLLGLMRLMVPEAPAALPNGTTEPPAPGRIGLGPGSHFGAGGGTRTRTSLRKTDFKSVASTIPPRPRCSSVYTGVASAAIVSALCNANENGQPCLGWPVKWSNLRNQAAMALRLRRQPTAPIMPSPAASSGSAAGSGTVPSTMSKLNSL